MEAHENMLTRLCELNGKAKIYKNKFDEFWRTAGDKRLTAHLSYFMRHAALLNAFNNFLFLFCSPEIWTAGGKGIWACSQDNTAGPLALYSNGDQIDKLEILIKTQTHAMAGILALHQSHKEKALLELEFDHLENTINLFGELLDQLE